MNVKGKIEKMRQELKENFQTLPKHLKELSFITDNKLPFLPSDFSLTQKRILAYSMGLIKREDRDKEIDKFVNTKFTIQVSNYKKIFNLTQSGGKIYSELKEACSNFFNRQIKVETADFEHIFNWVQDIKYVKNQGKIEINFTQAVAKYLTKLSANYTKYNVFISHNFKSIYTIRIYEMLQTMKHTNTIFMSLQELREVLQIPDSYASPAIIKRQILEKVKKELNEKLDLGFSYDVHRNKAYAGNYKVSFFAKKNEKNILNWLYEEEKVKKIETINNNNKNFIEVKSNDDLPF